MGSQFSRTRMLLGQEALDRLADARVAIFGIGGVGGYVCEALVRGGVGAFDLIDNDRVSLTNLNRQIIALHSTIGRYKTEVMRERMLDINPDADVRIRNCFFLPENASEFPFGEYDYVVDAVDTVTAKIELILRAQRENVPVISAMGAGNKLDPGRFRTADIYETRICPLARVMRRELKKRGVEKLKVVYSDEPPVTVRPNEENGGEEAFSGEGQDTADPDEQKEEGGTRRTSTPGSISYAPAVCGLMIAGEVLKDLTRR